MKKNQYETLIQFRKDLADVKTELKTDINRVETKVDKIDARVMHILGDHECRIHALEGPTA